MSATATRAHVVLYEDRLPNLVGVALCVASLARHLPGARVDVVAGGPGADPAFAAWCAGLPGVRLRDPAELAPSGWDVKPHLLLEALQESPEVWWLDTDVLLTDDLLARTASAPAGALVVTEEHPWAPHLGSDHRTDAWGLAPGRVLPTTANTGVLRVGRHHRGLLERWAQMLASPEYLHAQSQQLHDRPTHLLGDQEALTALLGSADHRDVEVHWLRQGRDIAQCLHPSSFSPADRVGALLSPDRRPVALHAMGRKPWEAPPRADLRRPRALYDLLHVRLSPYAFAASAHREQVSGAAAALGDLAWMGPTASPLAVMLAEAPLAVLDQAVRTVQAALGASRFQAPPPEHLRRGRDRAPQASG